MLTTLLCCAAIAAADIDTSKSAAEAAFERFKAMEGTWVGKETDNRKIKLVYEVIAGGSVVMQTSNYDAHPNEKMVTMFRMDKERLVLTHYCVAQNQPRLAATKISKDGKRVEFTFESGTNLKSRDQGHMDSVIWEFPDEDTYVSQWTWYQDGKSSWMEKFTVKRQK